MALLLRELSNHKPSLARLKKKLPGNTGTNTVNHQDRHITTVDGDDTHLFWGCSNPIPPPPESPFSPCTAKVYGQDNATAPCGATHPDCHTANDLLSRKCRACGTWRARGDTAVTQKGDVVGLYAGRDAVLYFEAHHCRADHFYWECNKDVGRAGEGARCSWKGPVY